MKTRIVLGTRGSALALTQTNHVRALLRRALSSVEVEIKIIKTTGDKKTTISLVQGETVGLFTKELEEALVKKKIDAAVHSLKDVPTKYPQGLHLGAILEREVTNDVLISGLATDFSKPNVIYTSSPRRAIQAKALWPECEIRPIRGNVETRLLKIAQAPQGEALLLAAAGLKRLDYLKTDSMEGQLSFEQPLKFRKLQLVEIIPAPGQGAIAIESRIDDMDTNNYLKVVNHKNTFFSTVAERAFLSEIGEGCAAPVGAYAFLEGKTLRLTACVGYSNGQIWRGDKTGALEGAKGLGITLAQEFRSQTSAKG
jgi:hydroxymethylbilane synthase